MPVTAIAGQANGGVLRRHERQNILQCCFSDPSSCFPVTAAERTWSLGRDCACSRKKAPVPDGSTRARRRQTHSTSGEVELPPMEWIPSIPPNPQWSATESQDFRPLGKTAPGKCLAMTLPWPLASQNVPTDEFLGPLPAIADYRPPIRARFCPAHLPPVKDHAR